MKSPFVPIALFAALVVSVLAALPLAGSLVVLSIVGFMGSLAALAWWVLWSDRAPVPVGVGALETLAVPDDAPAEWDWKSFESDFWAHVSEHGATSELD